MALTDPDEFAADMAVAARRTGGTDASVAPGRAMSGAALLAAWRADRVRLVDAARTCRPVGADPVVRPGDGGAVVHHRAADGDVGARAGRRRRARRVACRRPRGSSTSRTSACGLARSATRSTAWSCRPTPVYVALRAPDGSTWEWGEPAPDRVTGDALDFCLVVTQRRHRGRHRTVGRRARRPRSGSASRRRSPVSRVAADEPGQFAAAP